MNGLAGRQRPAAQAGFTLIEVVVALMLFSVLSVLGYEGLTSIVDYNERSRTAYERQNQLHRTSSILTQDILHLRARPVRDRFGSRQSAYHTTDPDYVVTFTRGGLPSVAGSSFGGMQRVAYSVSDDNELLRWTWPILDSFSEQEPRSRVLMEDVSDLRFYQLNNQNEFEENWPPLNQNIAAADLSRMIRIEIEMTNGAEIVRLMPGVQDLPQGAAGIGGASGQSTEDSDG